MDDLRQGHEQWQHQRSTWRELVRQGNYHEVEPGGAGDTLAAEAAVVAVEVAQASRLRGLLREVEGDLSIRVTHAEIETLREEIENLKKSHQNEVERLQSSNHIDTMSKQMVDAITHKALAEQKLQLDKAHNEELDKLSIELGKDKQASLAELKSCYVEAHKRALEELEQELKMQERGTLRTQKGSLDMQNIALQNQKTEVNESRSVLDSEVENRHIIERSVEDRQLMPEFFQPRQELRSERDRTEQMFQSELEIETQDRQQAKPNMRAEAATEGAGKARLQEEMDAREIAEAALAREVYNTDTLLDTLRDSLIEGSQYIGFQFPENADLNERIRLLAVRGKQLTSRMYQEPIEELSRYLGLELKQWPSFELTPQKHNEQVHAILKGHRENVTRMFDQSNVNVEEQERRTGDVRPAKFGHHVNQQFQELQCQEPVPDDEESEKNSQISRSSERAHSKFAGQVSSDNDLHDTPAYRTEDRGAIQWRNWVPNEDVKVEVEPPLKKRG